MHDKTPSRILFFIGGSYVAGVEIVSLNLIKGLKESGFEVRCVINKWNDGDFKTRLADIDVPFIEVKLGWIYLRKPFWTVDTLVHLPGAYIKCKRILKNFQPDIVHFCNFAMPLMLLPLVKPNSVYTLHDTQLPNLKHRIIYKLLNRKIAMFTAVSKHIALCLKNLAVPESKLDIVYNGIVMPPVQISPPKKNGDRPICFGIIGQIAEWKGHGILIDAVQLLINSGITNFKVYIIGNNENQYSKHLVDLIEKKKLVECFVWKGFIKDVESIYEGIDVVIVPSLCEEAFSLTTAEGMVRGLGVIVSNRGGMAELIDNRVNGLLFNYGDANELCKCMFLLLKERHLLQTLGGNAKNKARANYSYQAMTAGYIDIYERISASLKKLYKHD